jgi:hypothetical protein
MSATLKTRLNKLVARLHPPAPMRVEVVIAREGDPEPVAAAGVQVIRIRWHAPTQSVSPQGEK